MNLTNREKILMAIAFEQAITFTKMALDNNSSEIREANPLELAVEWLVWNVQEDNNSALKEMYDEAFRDERDPPVKCVRFS